MSDVPADLAVLRRLAANGKALPWPEVTLLGADEVPGILDSSYLTDDDRSNPDIMGNVAAIEETAALATWVASSEQSEAFGYWHGPEGVALAEAPIVMLSSEGEFRLLEGRSLSEAICGGLDFGMDFDEYAAACRALGITIEGDDASTLPRPEVGTDPADLHERLYREKTGYAG